MTNIEQYNNELYHYGVKGMKWGVRRSTAQLNRARKTAGKMVKRFQTNADYDTRVRDTIKENDYKQYKKYGYSSKEAARADTKNYDAIISDDRALAKKWSRIHSDIGKMTIKDVQQAKDLISSGKEHTNVILDGLRNSVEDDIARRWLDT